MTASYRMSSLAAATVTLVFVAAVFADDSVPARTAPAQSKENAATDSGKGKAGKSKSKSRTKDQARPKSDPPPPPSPSKDSDENQDEETAKGTAKAKDRDKPKIEKATFGGGCFWCIEAVFERIPGVKSVVSGYAGGHVPNPSYDMVCSGLTGHAEVIQIEYDPSVVSYEKLLNVFWMAHDPTTLNRQGDDFGTNYRSIILYHGEAQRLAAQKSYRELTARRVFRYPIVTELVPMKEFYPAEPYHQDFFRNHPDSDYSQIYIVPKLRKLKSKLK